MSEGLYRDTTHDTVSIKQMTYHFLNRVSKTLTQQHF